MRTLLFYLGLASTLVPLGVGSSFASRLFYGHRGTLITFAGWIIIVLGTVQLAGGGFSLKSAERAQSRIKVQSNASVFALGAVYGLAGFCSGPILGSVLMVAATSGQPIRGGALLAVYALGMSAPLFLLALVWDRFKLGSNRWLRGRDIKFGRVHLHTTSLISGLLFIAIGVLFLRYDGTAGITAVFGGSGLSNLDYKAQQWIQALGRNLDLVVFLTLGSGAIGLLVYHMNGKKREQNPLE